MRFRWRPKQMEPSQEEQAETRTTEGKRGILKSRGILTNKKNNSQNHNHHPPNGTCSLSSSTKYSVKEETDTTYSSVASIKKDSSTTSSVAASGRTPKIFSKLSFLRRRSSLSSRGGVLLSKSTITTKKSDRDHSRQILPQHGLTSEDGDGTTDEKYDDPFPFFSELSLVDSDRPVRVTVKTEPYVAEDIWTACKLGDEAFVRGALAHSPDIVNTAQDGRTPLYYACHRGHDRIAKRLLEAGATDPDGSIYWGSLNDACRQLLKEYRSFMYPKQSANTFEVPKTKKGEGVSNEPTSNFSEEASSPVMSRTASNSSDYKKNPSLTGNLPSLQVLNSLTEPPLSSMPSQAPEPSGSQYPSPQPLAALPGTELPQPDVISTESALSDPLIQDMKVIETVPKQLPAHPKAPLQRFDPTTKTHSQVELPSGVSESNTNVAQIRFSRVADLLREAVSVYSTEWEIETRDSHFHQPVKYEIENIDSVESHSLASYNNNNNNNYPHSVTMSSYESFDIQRSEDEADRRQNTTTFSDEEEASASVVTDHSAPALRKYNKEDVSATTTTATTDLDSVGMSTMRTSDEEGDSLTEKSERHQAKTKSAATMLEEYLLSFCMGASTVKL